jgi:ATP-dependent DNA helicase RecG
MGAIPEISVEAMREAIINAFCHRDYRNPDYVQVAVFKDRVEIRNPGELFDGLTIEELRKGNVSKRRNPLVAELLRRVHMVEAWGRGVPLILDKEPGAKFKEIAKLFITSFDRPSFGENVDKAVVTTQETTQEKIIACLKAEPTLTRKLLAQRIGISEGGIKYHLNKLKAAGKIRHVGPTKAGRWEVADGRFGAPDRGDGGGHE